MLCTSPLARVFMIIQSPFIEALTLVTCFYSSPRDGESKICHAIIQDQIIDAYEKVFLYLQIGV